MEEVAIINSVDEIKTCGVKYAHVSNPDKWILIKKDSGSYSIYGVVSGAIPTWVANGVVVKSWASFENTLRAIKRFSKDNSWGMAHWGS